MNRQRRKINWGFTVLDARKKFKYKSINLIQPEHYWHFGAASLRAALEKSGFEVVQEDHFSFEQNPYGWLQSLLNMVTPRFNFLYDWLKSKSARSAPLRKNPGQALLTLCLAVPMAPLSVLLTLLEAALRRGGSVEVYAVKR